MVVMVETFLKFAELSNFSELAKNCNLVCHEKNICLLFLTLWWEKVQTFILSKECVKE